MLPALILFKIPPEVRSFFPYRNYSTVVVDTEVGGTRPRHLASGTDTDNGSDTGTSTGTGTDTWARG